jgi:RNA polymerase sigma-70 factor (ECF subfamily)
MPDSEVFMTHMEQLSDPDTTPVPIPDAGPPTFEAFFDEHRRRLSFALWLIVHDRHEAEEIAQDAFLKVWERWDRVRRMDDPDGYLYRTAMNLQRNRRRRAVLAVKRTVRPETPRDGIAAVDTRDAVGRALSTLTGSQRRAIVLTDLFEYDSEEVGRILGIRASTVRVHVARARAALKEMGNPDD